ncbi:MAG: hypothetical protein CFE25_12090 [Chitinophagaceae bacterium BSSC1]|nr:MAG: hypothetical protein CFE25_12090 [Chitinophagaceae bacterium BSSC1]
MTSHSGLGQDTVFVNQYQFEEPVNNIDGDGKNLIVRSDNFLFQLKNGEFQKIAHPDFSKGRFSWLSQTADVDALQSYSTNVILKEKLLPQKGIEPFLPGYFQEGMTSAKIGNRYFVCYRGAILEYQIRNFYKVEHKSQSIRSIYMDDSVRVIASYSGVFVDSIFTQYNNNPIPGAPYSNGEVNKIGNNIYVNVDFLGKLEGNRIKEIVRSHDKYKFRKLISYKDKAICLTDYSIGIIDLNTYQFTDTLLTTSSGFNDAELIGKDLYVSSENGKLYMFSMDNLKLSSVSISEKPIYDINACSDTLYLSGQEGLFNYIPTSGVRTKLLDHPMVIQSLCLGNSILFTTYKGLYLFSDGKYYEIIHNVEFNKRALTIYDNYIYAGSIEGLFIIDWQLVKLDLIPGLSPMVINKPKYPLYIIIILSLTMCLLGLFIYRQKKKQKELVNIIHKKEKISPEGIRELMLQNEQIISVEAIAEYYQTSVNQLGRVLKKHDTTPLNLIKEIKKEMVLDMMDKDIPLSKIALRVGYREAYVKANFIKK